MKEENKIKKYLILTLKILTIIVFILLIKVSYGMGIMRGMIIGIAVENNGSASNWLCEKQNSTVDKDGYCILGYAESEIKIDCDFMNYKYIGERNLTYSERINYGIQTLLTYPAIRCKLNGGII